MRELVLAKSDPMNDELLLTHLKSRITLTKLLRVLLLVCRSEASMYRDWVSSNENLRIKYTLP